MEIALTTQEQPQQSATSSSPIAPKLVPIVSQLSLVPPFRFAVVEEGIYRGGYPTLRNFPFLKSKQIRTILSLTPEEVTYDLKEFCRAEGIRIKHIAADRHKGDPQLLPNDLTEALQVLIDPDMFPIYMHCLDGRHVIGLVVMALRKLQCWDYASMQMEFERYARESNNETAYISDYAGGIQLPARLPSWLWGAGSHEEVSFPSAWLVDGDGKLRKHPTLKLKLNTANSGSAAASAATGSNGPLRSNATALSQDSSAARPHTSQQATSHAPSSPPGTRERSFIDLSAPPPTAALWTRGSGSTVPPELQLWSIRTPGSALVGTTNSNASAPQCSAVTPSTPHPTSCATVGFVPTASTPSSSPLPSEIMKLSGAGSLISSISSTPGNTSEAPGGILILQRDGSSAAPTSISSQQQQGQASISAAAVIPTNGTINIAATSGGVVSVAGSAPPPSQQQQHRRHRRTASFDI